MQSTFMAQYKDDAGQHHRDMSMMMLAKQIESTECLVMLKLKILERIIMGAGSETQVFMSIIILMEKLEKLNQDLD
jgi:hypothetical protein